MTVLRDALAQHYGELVKVGFASGYVYIHEMDDETFSELERINDVYESQYRRLIAQHEDTIKNAEAKMEAELERARSFSRDNWMVIKNGQYVVRPISDVMKRKYKILLQLSPGEIKGEIANTKAVARRKKAIFENHLSSCPRFLEREVLRSYPSLPRINEGTIFICDGIEEGAYWFKKEFDHFQAQNKVCLKLFEGNAAGNGEKTVFEK